MPESLGDGVDVPLIDGLVETEKVALEDSVADILPDCVIVSLALLEEELDVDKLTETQPEELVLTLNEFRAEELDDVDTLTVTVEERDKKGELVSDDELEDDTETLCEFEAKLERVAETEDVEDNEAEGLTVIVPESLAEPVDVPEDEIIELPLTLEEILGLTDELPEKLL